MNEMITFVLNGKSVTVEADSGRSLLWVLRSVLNMTGTKYSCGEGICGACTVLLDNEAVRSCQATMAEVEGKSVLTIEGVASGEGLHPLQSAFIKHYALQCGFCTPGMILNALELLHKNPDPTREEIITAMDENLCRCGSYVKIVDAIQSVAGEQGEAVR